MMVEKTTYADWIDCHIHTDDSDGEGTIREVVELAIANRFGVIGFANHGPLLIGKTRRVTEERMREHIADIKQLKREYEGKIKILCGLEMDYVPSQESYLRRVISAFDHDLDFVLGSVHVIETGEERLSIWGTPEGETAELQKDAVWKQYFNQMQRLVASGLYTGIAHPDLILRSGLPNTLLQPHLRAAIRRCKENNMTWEINCSGFNKNDKATHFEGKRTYPDFALAEYAHSIGVPLSIGSDAHTPGELTKNIAATQNELQKHGITVLHCVERDASNRRIITPYEIGK